MEEGPMNASMQMASIVVGSTTLYSRSNSSIHRHAMLVSRKKAAQHEPVNESVKHLSQAQQPRSMLMGRFRVNGSPGKRQRKFQHADESTTEIPSICMEEACANSFSMNVPKLGLINQVNSRLFPHNVGSDQGFLLRLMQRSVFGQDPRALNSENAQLTYAVNDFALLHGLLTLSSLNLDLSTKRVTSRMSLILKGQTIKAVRERLSDSVQEPTLGTVGAVATLAAFDLLETYDDEHQPANNITFLQIAVRRKGGLKLFGQYAASYCSQCFVMCRLLSWLDCSYAILNDVPLLFAGAELPSFLPYSTHEHHAEPRILKTWTAQFRPLSASLSDLSSCVDHKDLQEAAPPDQAAQKLFLGDRICAVEKYLVGMHFEQIQPPVVGLVRLASFLYIARFVRMLPRRSRILAQLVSKMQDAVFALDFHVPTCGNTSQRNQRLKPRKAAQVDTSGTKQTGADDPGVLIVLFFSATIASIQTNDFESGGTSHSRPTFPSKDKFWADFLSSTAQRLQLKSVSTALECLDRLVYVTKACRKEGARALKSLGLLTQNTNDDLQEQD